MVGALCIWGRRGVGINLETSGWWHRTRNGQWSYGRIWGCGDGDEWCKAGHDLDGRRIWTEYTSRIGSDGSGGVGDGSSRNMIRFAHASLSIFNTGTWNNDSPTPKPRRRTTPFKKLFIFLHRISVPPQCVRDDNAHLNVDLIIEGILKKS